MRNQVEGAYVLYLDWLTVVLLLLPAAGLAYLFARITFAGLTTAGHLVSSLLPGPERRSRKKKSAISPRPVVGDDDG